MDMMPFKAKRKQEVEKSVSQTLIEENVSVKRKAIEKKAKQTLGSSISEDTVSLCSTLSDNALKCTIFKQGPKPKYDEKNVVSKNIIKSNEPRDFPKVSGPKNVSKGSISKSVSKGTISKHVPKKSSSSPVFEYVLKKASMDTAAIDDSNETISKSIPKLSIKKDIVRRNSKTKPFVEKFEIKKVPDSTNTDRTKKTESESSNIQTVVPKSAEPNLNVPKLMTKDNFEEIFAVPKLPLQAEALRCSTPRKTSCKKTKPKRTYKKKRGYKKTAVKTSKKASLKKTAAKTTVSVKKPSGNVDKNTSNKVIKNKMPEIYVSKSTYPRRAAALTAEVKITALQARYSAKLSEEAKKKKKKGTRGRTPKYRLLTLRTFKRLLTKIHRKIKPVIRQFLQLFCNHNFLQGGYNCYTHYKRVQYELERLYRILLKILKHLSKALHNVEGRHNHWLKKHNLYVPKKRKPKEKKINWTYPTRFPLGVLPVMERKPTVRRR